nr:MAG TPA: hypothetical protein [Caudoviricetes sp.]
MATLRALFLVHQVACVATEYKTQKHYVFPPFATSIIFVTSRKWSRSLPPLELHKVIALWIATTKFSHRA